MWVFQLKQPSGYIHTVDKQNGYMVAEYMPEERRGYSEKALNMHELVWLQHRNVILPTTPTEMRHRI